MIEKERVKRLENDAEANKTKKIDLISVYTNVKDLNKSTTLNEVGDLLKESDSEEDEQQPENKTEKSRSKQKQQAWLQEGDEENPLDLLDTMAIKSVLVTNPLTNREKDKAAAKNCGFKATSDGRLIIDDIDSDSDDDMKSKKSSRSRKSKVGDEDIDDMMDTLSITKKSTASAASLGRNKQNKRTAEEEDSDDEFVEGTVKSKISYKTGGSGIHRCLTANKKLNVHGSEYKSKKGTGDVKIKNRPDPYAYIPFNPEKLNKRKKAKLKGEFKEFVKTGKANKQTINEKNKRKRTCF